jgi:flagellar basal body-associated protein FliL
MIVFLSAEPIQGITEKETLEHIRKEIRRITNQHLGEPFVKRVLLEKFAVQ